MRAQIDREDGDAMGQDHVPVLNIQPIRRRKFTPSEPRTVPAEGNDAGPAAPAPSEDEARGSVSSSLHVRRRIRQLEETRPVPAAPAPSSLHVRRKIRQLQATALP